MTAEFLNKNDVRTDLKVFRIKCFNIQRNSTDDIIYEASDFEV